MKKHLMLLCLTIAMAGCDLAEKVGSQIAKLAGEEPVTIVFQPGYVVVSGGIPLAIIGQDACPKPDRLMQIIGGGAHTNSNDCLVIPPSATEVSLTVVDMTNGKSSPERWTVTRSGDNDLRMHLFRENGDPVVVDTYAAQAKLLPNCATEAAQEFGAPVRVFQAMALAEQGQPGLNPSGGYGPMGFGEIAIPMAADGIGADIDAVKNDPCTNYRAAAWWLMKDVGNKTGDIWPAVTNYYYGKTDHSKTPAVDLVKAIYKRIEG